MRWMPWAVALCLGLSCAHTSVQEPVFHVGTPKSFHGAKPEIRVVHIDADFGVRDVESIMVAADRWNVALNGNRLLFPIVEKVTAPQSGVDDIYVYKVDSSTCTFIPGQQDGGKVLAFADSIGGRFIWVLRDRIEPEDLTGISMHELGHVLGAVHTDGGLMNAIYYRVGRPCIDFMAVSQVAVAIEAPLETVTYCENGR